jgi:adenosylhomocysteinase
MVQTLIVTGSLAYDSISVFNDHFKNHILPDKIHQINLSFTTDQFKKEFGGTAGNIAYNISILGHTPTIVATAGNDFHTYNNWLEKNNIDTSCITIVPNKKTAAAHITTDLSDNQIASFAIGAMNNAADNPLTKLEHGSLVIVSPNQKEAFLQHAKYCQENNLTYILDPGQTLPMLSGDELKLAAKGSELLILNDYEWELWKEKTGLHEIETLKLTQYVIITLGEKGSKILSTDAALNIQNSSFNRNSSFEIRNSDLQETVIPAVKNIPVVDPTGSGDAYRAGLMVGLVQEKDLIQAAELGTVLASFCVGAKGTQNHHPSQDQISMRLHQSFGKDRETHNDTPGNEETRKDAPSLTPYENQKHETKTQAGLQASQNYFGASDSRETPNKNAFGASDRRETLNSNTFIASTVKEIEKLQETITIPLMQNTSTEQTFRGGLNTYNKTTGSTGNSSIKDPSLAEQGRMNIEFAEAHMGALMEIRKQFELSKPFTNMTIGMALHVTKETAVLVRTLKAGGARVVITGCNPLSTQDDVAAALAMDGDAEVHAHKGESTEEYYQFLNKVIAAKPDITIDDGCDLVTEIHNKHPHLIPSIIGGCEETTTGIIRLNAMEKDGALKYPVIAVNDNKTKHLMDNYYGTGQSTLDGIIRSTNILFAGKTVVVIGYGSCGKGVAMRAKGLGANVIVTEIDNFCALQAKMDGFRVMPLLEAAPIGDIFITVTGNLHVIDRQHMEKMKDGAIMANSGHFDNEINLQALNKLSRKEGPLRKDAPSLTPYENQKHETKTQAGLQASQNYFGASDSRVTPSKNPFGASDSRVTPSKNPFGASDSRETPNTNPFGASNSKEIPSTKRYSTDPNPRRVRHYLDEYTLQDGRKLFVAGEGRLVNLASAEGHPSEVMSLSFCGQALACKYLVDYRGTLPNKVIQMPPEIDDYIASLQLKAMNTNIDQLTTEQLEYLSSWQHGT